MKPFPNLPLDRNDTKIFHIVCPSLIGALPLGELVTTREDAPTILHGLEMLKAILPKDAFYGRGELGPICIMTDDSDAERNALARAWASAILLLCVFHVLQAMWCWIWDSKHGIASSHKGHILQLFRTVLFAESESDLDSALEAMNSDPISQAYPQFHRHLEDDTLPKIKSWSLANRISMGLPTSHNNTNNLVESSFRYTKDIQFNRIKAFNLPDLLTTLLDNSQFYSEKCIDAANNVIESWLRNCNSKYYFGKSRIDPSKIISNSDGTFLVPSESVDSLIYLVDMKERYCSCNQGRLKGPCKHKALVSERFGVECFDVIPSNNPTMRQTFMYLGTGKKMDINWFLGLQDEAQSLEVTVPDIRSSVNCPPLNSIAYEEIGKIDNDTSGHILEIMEDDGNYEETWDKEDEDLDNDNKATNKTRQNDSMSTNYSPEDAFKELDVVLEKMKQKLVARIPSDPNGYMKAIQAFKKGVEKIPATKDPILQKALYSFGKTETQVAT